MSHSSKSPNLRRGSRAPPVQSRVSQKYQGPHFATGPCRLAALSLGLRVDFGRRRGPAGGLGAPAGRTIEGCARRQPSASGRKEVLMPTGEPGARRAEGHEPLQEATAWLYPRSCPQGPENHGCQRRAARGPGHHCPRGTVCAWKTARVRGRRGHGVRHAQSKSAFRAPCPSVLAETPPPPPAPDAL